MLKNLWEKIKAIFDLNNDGRITAEDAAVAQAVAEAKIKDANRIINEAKAETKRRAKRVKEELVDIKEAAAEVVDQAADVVDAVKGKNRPGRKKK